MPEFLTKFDAFFKEKPYRLFWVGAVLIVLIPVFFYSLLLAPSLKDIKKGVVDVHLEMAKNIQGRSEGFLSEHVNALQDLAQILTVCQENERKLFIDRFIQKRKVFVEIFFLNDNGQEVLRRSQRAVFAPQELRDLSWSEIFVKPMEGNIHLSNVYTSLESGSFVTAAVPVKTGAGQISGVLVGELSLQQIWDTISRVKIGTLGSAYIVDSRGYLIAHPNFLLVLKKTNLFSRPAVEKVLIEKRTVDGTEKDDEYLNEKGQKSYVAGIYWPEMRWGVFIEESSKDTWAAYRRTQNLGLASIGGMAILLLLLFFLIRILSQTGKELKQKYTQLEFQKNELDKTTKILIQRDLSLSETRDWLREALVKSDKARVGLEESRAALMNLMEDAEESRVKTEEEKNKTQAIIVNFTDGLLVFDPKDRISLINPQAEIFFGIKTEQVIGKHLSELENFPALKPLFDFFGQEIKKIFREELSLNENLIVEVGTVPILHETERLGTLVIIHDVTREKMIAKTKSEFISLVAHQLRAPLSGMKWILRMLLDGDYGPLSGEQKDIITKGYESNYSLINLVNDLLDVARLEEGRFGFDFSENDFNKALTEITDSFEEDAKKARVILLSSVPRKPLIFVFDLQRMKMVFSNLVANAIRYTKAGGQVLISSKTKDGQIEVVVKDTGVGIPRLQKERVFTKFFRGDNIVKMQAEGSGLGLYLAKNIVEKHGGKIWFETEEGRGSIFYFTIPMK